MLTLITCLTLFAVSSEDAACDDHNASASFSESMCAALLAETIDEYCSSNGS